MELLKNIRNNTRKAMKTNQQQLDEMCFVDKQGIPLTKKVLDEKKGKTMKDRELIDTMQAISEKMADDDKYLSHESEIELWECIGALTVEKETAREWIKEAISESEEIYR